MKYLKKYENNKNKNKNTEINFYWTTFTNREFSKYIFNVIVKGELDKYEVSDWIDSNSSEIYNKFYLETVFEHVVMNYTYTDKKPTEVKNIKVIPGKLVFEDNLDQEILKTKGDIYDINKEIKKNKEEPKEEKKYPSVWIKTDGTRQEVGFAEHNSFAINYLKENYPKKYQEYQDSNKYAHEILEDMGWIRVLGWAKPPKFVISKLNPKTKKAIKDYCQQYGVPYPERIKD